MKKSILKCASLVAWGLSMSACSTITTGTTQDFGVNTPHADGASCDLKDSKGAMWSIPSTPGEVVVSKGDGPMTVTCRKDGYIESSIIVNEGFAGMTLGNVILGGGVGIVVDAVSGAAQEYPDTVYVWLEPVSWGSDEAKAEWEKSKAAFEAEQEAKKENTQENYSSEGGNE